MTQHSVRHTARRVNNVKGTHWTDAKFLHSYIHSIIGLLVAAIGLQCSADAPWSDPVGSRSGPFLVDR